MAIETKYEINVLDIQFNHYQSSLYQLMRCISTSLFSGCNRTNTLKDTIDITNKCPYSEIPDVEVLKNNGKHTLRFTVLSDTGCTSSVSCDSLFSCYTPSIIGSLSLNIEGFQGTSNLGVNKYLYKFVTEQGNKLAAIESIDKQSFCESKEWTQSELNTILRCCRVPDWGREKIAPTCDKQKIYMLMGLSNNELLAKEVKWSEIGAEAHFSSPNLSLRKSVLNPHYTIIDPKLFTKMMGPPLVSTNAFKMKTIGTLEIK